MRHLSSTKVIITEGQFLLVAPIEGPRLGVSLRMDEHLSKEKKKKTMLLEKSLLKDNMICMAMLWWALLFIISIIAGGLLKKSPASHSSF